MSTVRETESADCLAEYGLPHYEPVSSSMHEQVNLIGQPPYPHICLEATLTNSTVDLTDAMREMLMKKKMLKMRQEKRSGEQQDFDRRLAKIRAESQRQKESFVRHNRRMLLNDENRSRAEKRSADEKQLQAMKKEAMDSLEKEIERLGLVRTMMRHHVNDHSIFEAYLQRVVDSKSSFESVDDVMSRYEDLKDAHKLLTDRLQRGEEQMEAARTAMEQLEEESQLAMMGLNNRLISLTERYARVRNSAVHWELAAGRLNTAWSHLAMEQEQVRAVCADLCAMAIRRGGVPAPENLADVESQLIYIKRVFKHLRQVLKKSRKLFEVELSREHRQTITLEMPSWCSASDLPILTGSNSKLQKASRNSSLLRK